MPLAAPLAQVPRAHRSAPATMLVGSGKGGVGKSVVSILLAHALASNGRRVLLCDADYDLPNLHLLLGITPAAHSDALLSGEVSPADLVRPVGEGLWLLAGDSDATSASALSALDRARLYRRVTELYSGFDAVVVDAGAGLDDVLLVSGFGVSRMILVTTPETAALSDAFALVGVLASHEAPCAIDVLINRTLDDDDGAASFARLQLACGRLLDRQVRCLGYLPEDPTVGLACRRRSDALSALTATPSAQRMRGLVRTGSLLTRPAAGRSAS